MKMQKLKKFSIVEKNIGDILYMPEDALTDVFIITEGAVGVFSRKTIQNVQVPFIMLSKYGENEIINEHSALSTKTNPYGGMVISKKFSALKISAIDFIDM